MKSFYHRGQVIKYWGLFRLHAPYLGCSRGKDACKEKCYCRKRVHMRIF